MRSTTNLHGAKAVALRWAKRWFALVIALIPGVLVGALGFFLYVMAQPAADGEKHHYAISETLGSLLLVSVLSLPLVVPFAILAAPFVPFQRWIVTGRFPFLRPGYLGVAAYGPLLLAMAYLSGGHGYETWTVLYEVVALVTTMLFVPLGHRFGVMDEPRNPPPESHF